jgi:putative membrane protein
LASKSIGVARSWWPTTWATWCGGCPARFARRPTDECDADDLPYVLPAAWLMDRAMPLASPHTINDREALAAIVSAAAVTASGLLVLLAYDLGPHSTHMALHIAAMSVLAPVTAALAADRIPRSLCNTSALWSSAAVQLALLWAWHVPAVQRVASESHALHVGALALLFACSFVFWSAVIRAASAARWHAIAALLVTGKLTCLISVLLIFSPRALYAAGGHAGHGLDDQQLAGLLMVTACPLSYLIAAVVIVARFLNSPSPLRHRGPLGMG